MDDVIYANFRKNVLLPVHMVLISTPTGTLETKDVKQLALGAGSFASEMRPRSIVPMNAKELMLKDADYSTP